MTSLLDIGTELRSAPQRVPVLLPVALDQTYDYVVPGDIAVEPGAFVLAPLGSLTRIGVVWDHALGDHKPVDQKKMKAVIARLDVPALPETCLRFAEWIARYTISPLGMVVRMMMGAPAAFDPLKPRFGVRLADGASEPARMTVARRRVVEIAADGLVRAKSGLAAEAGCTSGVIDGLVEAGVLVEVAVPERRYPRPTPAHKAIDLSEEQARAAHALCGAVDAASFSVTLLDGVTGSGKTEVYFEAVARALEAARQALIMLPEIALTSQFMRPV